MKKLERQQTLVEFLFDLYGAGKPFRIGRTVAAKVCDELPKFNRARLDRGEPEIHFLVDGQDGIFELSNAAESVSKAISISTPVTWPEMRNSRTH